jgi:protease-4
MSFDSDIAIDRRRTRRHLKWWRLVSVIAVAALLIVAFAENSNVFTHSHIARISVSGIIVESQFRARTLRRIGANKKIKALIVHINSPGGTVVGGESLYLNLRAVAAKKPVIAVMGTLAASGGYMAALGADHILAREGTVTGSIGVILQSTDVTGLLGKLGIKAEAIKSAPLKAVPSPFEPLTQKGRDAARTIVMDMYGQFVGMVAKRRDMSLGKARKLADGRIFTGRQALKLGLIDGIGGETQARIWLTKSRDLAAKLPLKDVRTTRKSDGPFDFFRQMMGKTLFSERLTLDGLISLWQPE